MTNIGGIGKILDVITNSNSHIDTPKTVAEETPTIKDSGSMTNFDSGARRDYRIGKGRCDLLPLDVVRNLFDESEDEYTINMFDRFYKFQETGSYSHLIEAVQYFVDETEWISLPTMLLEVSKHYEEGANKYGENNWQNGMPTNIYIDSAIRHYLKFLRGDEDEPHDKAFVWNILCCIWTCIHKPELNTYSKPKDGYINKSLLDINTPQIDTSGMMEYEELPEMSFSRN